MLLQLSCSTDKQPEEATDRRSKMLVVDVSKVVRRGMIPLNVNIVITTLQCMCVLVSVHVTGLTEVSSVTVSRR